MRALELSRVLADFQEKGEPRFGKRGHFHFRHTKRKNVLGQEGMQMKLPHAAPINPTLSCYHQPRRTGHFLHKSKVVKNEDSMFRTMFRTMLRKSSNSISINIR